MKQVPITVNKITYLSYKYWFYKRLNNVILFTIL